MEGFIDVLDLLSFLVEVSTRPSASGSTHPFTDDLNTIVGRGKEFSLTNVTELIGIHSLHSST